MSTALTSQLVDELLAACRAGQVSLAALLTPLAGAPVQAQVGEFTEWSNARQQLEGAALAIAIQVDDAAVLAVLPLASGLLRHMRDGDQATLQALLSLAGKLGPAILPKSLRPYTSRMAMLHSAADALQHAGAADDAAALPIELTTGDNRTGTLWIVWPATQAEAALGSAAVKLNVPTTSGGGTSSARRASELPNYVNSLLRISVPVIGTLVSKKQSINEILEVGPGAIIQFEKPCDDLLDLEVNGRVIARGEAVKVGDKFGLRLTALIMPGERFQPLGKRK